MNRGSGSASCAGKLNASESAKRRRSAGNVGPRHWEAAAGPGAARKPNACSVISASSEVQ